MHISSNVSIGGPNFRSDLPKSAADTVPHFIKVLDHAAVRALLRYTDEMRRKVGLMSGQATRTVRNAEWHTVGESIHFFVIAWLARLARFEVEACFWVGYVDVDFDRYMRVASVAGTCEG